MRYLDDVCVGTGAILGGVGVYLHWPSCVWFYAAAWCIVVGVSAGRVR